MVLLVLKRYFVKRDDANLRLITATELLRLFPQIDEDKKQYQNEMNNMKIEHNKKMNLIEDDYQRKMNELKQNNNNQMYQPYPNNLDYSNNPNNNFNLIK